MPALPSPPPKATPLRKKPSSFKRLSGTRRTPGWLRRLRRPRPRNTVSKPLITVIIPIYDTEEYVEKCLRSVMAQTLSEIEIICVDDASPDASAEIVERLAREDDRIHLIRHDRNLGAGGARNTGIEAARAPYVTGVDSDDHIKPEMMARLWEASGEGTADIVACGFVRVDPSGTPLGLPRQPPSGRFRNDNDQVDIFEHLSPSFCIKIWRRSLFIKNEIRFPENTYFEDLAVTPQLMRFAKDIRVISDVFYQYVVRAESVTNSCSAKHLVDHFKVFDILDDFLVREGLMDRYETEFATRICKSLKFHASSVIASDMDEREKEQYLRFALMLQASYLRYKDRLRNENTKSIRNLFQLANCDSALNRKLAESRKADP